MTAAEDTHSPTPEEIMEYLDGEGTVASRTGIEAHLARCGECQALASEQRRLSEGVSAWHVDRAPASLRAPAAPRARVLPARVRLAWRPSGLTLAAVGAAAAVLVAVVVSLPFSRSSRVRSVDTATVIPESVVPGSPTRTPGEGVMSQLVGRTPSVVRTATLRIVTKDFDGVRAAIERIVAAAGGFVDQLTVTGDAGSPRALRGTLRIPSDGLGEVADRLRRLGQVVEDSQASQDVTDQLIDIGVRLASARATERRLTELLRDRTGKLSDVLAVERELARVRVDIERLDAETANIGRRVSYATLNIDIVEERKAGFDPGPLSLASRFRVAWADGLESALESVAWTLLFLLRAGPFLVLWIVVLASGRRILRRALGRWRSL